MTPLQRLQHVHRLGVALPVWIEQVIREHDRLRWDRWVWMATGFLMGALIRGMVG